MAEVIVPARKPPQASTGQQNQSLTARASARLEAILDSHRHSYLARAAQHRDERSGEQIDEGDIILAAKPPPPKWKIFASLVLAFALLLLSDAVAHYLLHSLGPSLATDWRVLLAFLVAGIVAFALNRSGGGH